VFVLRHPARFLLAGLALASFSAAASSETFWGIGQAKDGDSLMVGSREVRLFGIDAPEFEQQCKRAGQSWACGSEARERLSQLATGRDVRCVSVETDQYGRFLSRCSAGGTDLNRAMVASGYAVASRAIGTGEGSGSTICLACPTTTRLELSKPSARRLRREPRDTEGPW
jgi:endonuclease YncB( thermonuclease family)